MRLPTGVSLSEGAAEEGVSCSLVVADHELSDMVTAASRQRGELPFAGQLRPEVGIVCLDEHNIWIWKVVSKELAVLMFRPKPYLLFQL
jgi:hypothetical protein